MNDFFIIQFNDRKVIWSDQLIMLPNITTRFIVKRAMDILRKHFPNNSLRFNCNEDDLGLMVGVTNLSTFESLCIHYVINPNTAELTTDAESLLH